MPVIPLSPEILKNGVLEFIAECRQRLDEGTVDISGMERKVQDYCDIIAALPLSEGRQHSQALHEVMQAITGLEEALTTARNAVQKELQALDRLQRAQTAYHKSDTIDNGNSS